MPALAELDVETPQGIAARKRTLLANVERALLDALAESPEVQRSIWQLQKAGYTLSLSIEGQESPLAVRADPPAAAAGAPPAGAPATFRIDARDLGFLRSIGIDPTRRPRPRRRA